MEFAAFGFVVLVWWTWPIVFVVVMAAVWAGYRLENWREDRKIRQAGPHPCLAHISTRPDLVDVWCWLKEGHDGPHRDQFGTLNGLHRDYSVVCEHQYIGRVCVLDNGHEGPHDMTDGT